MIRATRPAGPPAQPICRCHGGPRTVATFRNDQVSVAIEHWAYCPIRTIPIDPAIYAATGNKIPIGGGQ